MNIPDWQPAQYAQGVKKGKIDIWYVDLNPAHASSLMQKDALYAADELARAARFRFDQHRRQYLVGRCALRQILAHYTNVRPNQVVFKYGEYGKPSIETFDLEFNLSNSHERAVIGVTQGEAIGIDIEYRDRHIWDVNSLAESVFTPIEQKQLNSYDPEQRLVPFLSGWTRKEAYLKGVGKGLALPLKDFSVDLTNSAETPHISVAEWRLRSFWSAEEYLCAIAYPDRVDIPEFNWFEWDPDYLGSTKSIG